MLPNGSPVSLTEPPCGCAGQLSLLHMYYNGHLCEMLSTLFHFQLHVYARRLEEMLVEVKQNLSIEREHKQEIMCSELMKYYTPGVYTHYSYYFAIYVQLALVHFSEVYIL